MRSPRSTAVGVANRTDFRAALAAVLVSRREHLPLFEQAFDLFWRNPKLLEKMLAALLPRVHGRTGDDDGAARAARAPCAGDAAARSARSARRTSDEIELDAALHVLAARGAAEEGLRDDDRGRAARR